MAKHALVEDNSEKKKLTHENRYTLRKTIYLTEKGSKRQSVCEYDLPPLLDLLNKQIK